jgi:hypothetical protein
MGNTPIADAWTKAKLTADMPPKAARIARLFFYAGAVAMWNMLADENAVIAAEVKAIGREMEEYGAPQGLFAKTRLPSAP